MVAEYTATKDSFVAKKPRVWADKQLADVGTFPSFDVSSDGKRVVAVLDADESKLDNTGLHVLLNVNDELNRHSQRK